MRILSIYLCLVRRIQNKIKNERMENFKCLGMDRTNKTEFVKKLGAN
jgi:hypothetical protein